jgi:hypothetical protein
MDIMDFWLNGEPVFPVENSVDFWLDGLPLIGPFTVTSTLRIYPIIIIL